MLFGADELSIHAEPAPWCVGAGESRGLLEGRQVCVHLQLPEGPRGALGDEDIYELARARSRVEHPGLHHQLFPSGRVPFGACVEDVVKQRPTTNRARASHA